MPTMSRRSFLQTAGAAALSAAAWPACSPPRPRPNVLFIAIDDLNDWIGCLGGHPDVRTPHLDRLASRSMLFTRAYCPAPACNPSRAALMSGVRPSTSGVYVNPQPWRQSPVLADAVTLPQHFRAHGYRAMGSGKIYHGAYPDPPSWDEYWPDQQRNKPDDPVPGNRPLNGIPNTAHFDWGPVDARPEDMGDWQVTDWVRGQLAAPHRDPFFLACGLFRPHLPWYVPQEYFDRYPLQKVTLPEMRNDDLDDVPEAGRRMARPEGDHRRVVEHDQWRRAVQGYLACISFADDCVGRVLDALERSAHSEDTIVVLWSDHGWHLGEKLHWRKFALWEEATHNVLTVSAPGVGRPGRCDAPVNLLDLYPTLTELAGLPPRPGLEGVSLVPLLENPSAPWLRPALTTYGKDNHSVRSRRWRYIRYADGSEELYDHDVDDLEWTNLAGDPQYAEVKDDHVRWLPQVNAPESPRQRRS